MNETRRKLIEGTIATLRDKGIAGTSARAIAAAAGVNQALVFYHFGSVDELIDVAGRESTEERVAVYRPQFAEVTSLRGLLTLGRDLHVREREAGNVAVLAQVLAGAQQHPALAAAAQHSLSLWVAEIESVLTRLLKDSPLAEVTDSAGLARGIAASFIGIELYEGVDQDGAESALASLEMLGLLVEVVDDLGPVARRALRAKLRRTTRSAQRSGAAGAVKPE
jgi:AcrR family transcriptional regulator